MLDHAGRNNDVAGLVGVAVVGGTMVAERTALGASPAHLLVL